MLLYLDKIWCGNSLLSCKAILPLSNNAKEITGLARLRLLSMGAVLGELTGLLLLLYGAMGAIASYFIIGISLKIISHLVAGIIHNRSGAFLSLWWLRHLSILRTYQRELSGLLNHCGLTDAEIKGLPALPTELYSVELNSYPYSFVLNFATPLVSVFILILYNELYSALLIGSLGMLALPLGNWFYQQFTFRQQREQRLAQTAHAYDSLAASYNRHINLTFQVNLLAQLPLALFTLCFALGISSALFANYLAFTMGLAGLTGLLAFQKLRVGSQHSIEKAKHLLNALCSSEFLLTEKCWQAHVSKDRDSLCTFPFDSGIRMQHFTPTAFGLDRAKLPPMTLSIPSGSVYLFQAPSGHGKSMLLLALLHVIDHEGSLFWISKGQATNVHDIDRAKWLCTLIFFREEDLSPTARLVDLLNEICQTKLAYLVAQMNNDFGKELAFLAWNGADNLVESEIIALQNGQRSPFPPSMLPSLIHMRYARDEVCVHLLKTGYGKNTSIVPERVFCTLSAGERRRMINLLTLETARKSADGCFIVFDEPLAHLDDPNISLQLSQIAELQKNTHSPILMITHHNIKEIGETLSNVIC
jgi:energy-coupling factor transporter ATP-binding protein EcfA2